MMKYIAILLTVHNRLNETKRCLTDLYNISIPPDCVYDVFLTDDGCTDGTSEVIKELFPNVTIIYGNGDLYWNRGMWLAWDIASKIRDYDYYLWLNDDTMLYKNALLRLIAESELHDDKAIIVGPCQAIDHSKMTYGGKELNGFLIIPNKRNSTRVFLFNGNVVLIPCAVYYQLGNLDNYYRHCWGDSDYSLRAYKNGIESFQVSDYVAECDLHENLSAWCNPNVPFMIRLKSLSKPTGLNPKEVFHFNRKKENLFMAYLHYVTVYVRCVFPSLWLKRKNRIRLK